MIFIRHSESCAGKPTSQGRLTGKCNCKTAKLGTSARERLRLLLDNLEDESSKAGEEAEYLALRLDELAEQIAKAAHTVRLSLSRKERPDRSVPREVQSQRDGQ